MIPAYRRFKKWSLPSKWSFIGAILGIILGTVSIIVGIDFDNTNISCNNIDRKNDNLDQLRYDVCEAMVELANNSRWLEDAILSNKSGNEIPIGRLNYVATRRLIENNAGILLAKAYGEEGNFERFSNRLFVIGNEINSQYRNYLKAYIEYEAHYTLYDILFMNEFVRWYIRPLGKDMLPKRHYDFVMSRPLEDHISQIGQEPIAMKLNTQEGKAITEFGYMLGLLD